MTYWAFHCVFILPCIGVLAFLNRRFSSSVLPNRLLGFLLVGLVALLYTAPWDEYLISRGVWTYQLDRISGALRLGKIPLEEVCFFLLQPLLTGLYLLFFTHRFPESVAGLFLRQNRFYQPRLIGGVIFSLLTLLGAIALHGAGRATYFGLLLIWACPVLAFQWIYGGDYLWRARALFWATLVSASVYLFVVDRIALEWKIWSISPLYSTGWNILGLPLEEAAFFVLTNLLVIQGLLLFFRLLKTRKSQVLT